MADIYARVMNIYGSEADWSSNDIVLLQGEIGFANVGGIILGKVGDGVSAWSALEYTLGTAAILAARRDGAARGLQRSAADHAESDLGLGRAAA